MQVFVLSLLEYQNGALNLSYSLVYADEKKAIAELDKVFHRYCDLYDIAELDSYNWKYDDGFHLEDTANYTYEITASITPQQIIE